MMPTYIRLGITIMFVLILFDIRWICNLISSGTDRV